MENEKLFLLLKEVTLGLQLGTKLKREPGSMIKVPGTPGIMTIQHNKNIKQDRCKKNTTNLERNL